VANAPYVPTEAIGLLPQEARLHEPRLALDGGADGLDVLRRVIGGAPSWLAPGGSLVVEASERQARQTAETVARNGLLPRVAGPASWTPPSSSEPNAPSVPRALLDRRATERRDLGERGMRVAPHS